MDAWAEVRQLVADFQNLQSCTTSLRLSERNCIELVTSLNDIGLIQILYTLDGKEYVTPQCLEKEIRNEISARQGRVNIVHIQKILNVDLTHIEAKVAEILKHDRTITLLSGELITRSYLDELCEEINDNLHEVGQMDVAELSKHFSLPNDFLLEVIESALDSKIIGQLDKSGSGFIYTESYIKRYRSRIRGLFSAITCPAPIGPIIVEGHFQERLFFFVLHSLISASVLQGTLRGQGEKSVFIPKVYVSLQAKWVDSFFLSNGYLEYDALKRIGIDNSPTFVLKHFSDKEGQNVKVLCTCAIGETILNELEGAVDDIRTTGPGWIDSLTFLPSLCTSEDAELLCQKKYSSISDIIVFGKFLTTPQFLQECIKVFSPDIKERAKEVACCQSSKVSEIAQRIAIKENVITKSVRKGKRAKARQNVEEDGDEYILQFPIKFMCQDKASRLLSDHLLVCDELSELITSQIENSLQIAFVKEAVLYLSTVSALKEQSSSELRKKRVSLQQRIESVWYTAKLFKQGISHFEGSGTIQLSKYLLRTLCSDLVNLILVCIAEDNEIGCSEQNLTTNKERLTVILKLPSRIQAPLSTLNSSLNEKDLAAFFDVFEKVCQDDCCSIMLKKPDKKKERQLIYSHQMQLKKNLTDEQDNAVCLHLIVILLFHQKTGSIVHIPGKFVPSMISFLASHVPDQIHKQLLNCQRLIASRWKTATMVSFNTETDIPTDEKEVLSPANNEKSSTSSHSSHIDEYLKLTSPADDIEAELDVLLTELKHVVM